MKIQIAFLLIALFTLGACSSVDVTKTSQGFYQPTNPDDVVILRTEPRQDFEELGTFTATCFKDSETASMHDAIRLEAAKVGGHAALIQDKELTPKQQRLLTEVQTDLEHEVEEGYSSEEIEEAGEILAQAGICGTIYHRGRSTTF